jgi:hypothetical protein
MRSTNRLSLPILAAAVLISLCLVGSSASAADLTPIDAEDTLVLGTTTMTEDGCSADLVCTYPYIAPPASVSCTGSTSCSVGAGYVVCDGDYEYCTCPTIRCASWYACWKIYGDEAACYNGCCDTLL